MYLRLRGKVIVKSCMVVGISALLVLVGWPKPTFAAEDPVAFFQQNCVSCHTIGGGRLTGPDLKDVSNRQERGWLVKFMLDPQSMIDSGDPYALELYESARRVVMTKISGMNSDIANSLLDLIEAESLLEESQFIGMQISDEPFTPEDIAKGKAYFTGNSSFENGAPACISCHTTTGLGGFGGGRLGPDLTKVFDRMLDRKGLASWLLAPATTTMQPVFKNKALKSAEIMSLVAFLEDRTGAKQGDEASASSVVIFMLCGLGGAFLLLVIFDWIWKFRFKAVRIPLVNSFKFGRIKE